MSVINQLVLVIFCTFMIFKNLVFAFAKKSILQVRIKLVIHLFFQLINCFFNKISIFSVFRIRVVYAAHWKAFMEKRFTMHYRIR